LFFIPAQRATTDRAFKRGDDRLMELFDSGVYLKTAKTILKVNAHNQGKANSTK